MNQHLLISLKNSVSRFDVLIILGTIWFLGKFIRYAFPPLFELLQQTFAVSTTLIGWSFSLFLFAYAMIQFPSGYVCDKFGTKSVISGGILVSSVGALIHIIDTSFFVYLFLMVILGVGTGVHKTAAVQLLSDTYPAHKGRVLGIFDTFGTVGGVVAPLAVIIAASIPGTRPGWRILLFGTGIFGLVIMATFIIRIDDGFFGNIRKVFDQNIRSTYSETSATANATNEHLNSDTAWSSYTQLFVDRRFNTFVVASICFAFTYQGIVAFLPLYLIQEAGLTPSRAGALYSILFLAGFCQVVAGEFSDKFGTLPVIIGALSLTTASILLLIVGTDAGIFVLGVATLSIGLGAHSFRPVRGAYLMDSLPDDLSAGGLGIVRTLLMGSGAIAPGIVGTIADIFSFRLAFVILSVSIGVATALSILLLLMGPNSVSNSSTS